MKRIIAMLLCVCMVISLAACGAPPAQMQEQEQPQETVQPAPESPITSLESEESAELDRDDKELIAELIGGQDAADMSNEELDQFVDDLIHNLEFEVDEQEQAAQKPADNQNAPAQPETPKTEDPETEEPVVENPVIDTEAPEGTYNDQGEMTKPFDQVYPDLIEDGKVSFSGESILIKLKSGKLTEGLKAAGVGALDEIVPLEGMAWYEAKLIEGTDAKEALDAVRELDEVLLAEYNYTVTMAALDEYQDFSEEQAEIFGKNSYNKDQWHFHHCGIPSGYEEMTYAGGDSSVVVAVIDSGVDYDHEDLKDNIWVNDGEIPDNGIDDDKNGYVDDYYGVDIVAGSGNGDDTNGHGTHVAGIIAAANNNTGVLGIAYNVKVMSVKAAAHNGTLNQADIAKAVLYAYSMGAEVINMSFGGTACSIAVQDALATAYTRCVLVASAGNSGARNEGFGAIPNYPAALTYVLGVMSVDQNGVESSFTNYDVFAFNGVEYEVYAPGENIMSTLPGNQYGYLSGTSMAAPVVSAFAAILRSEFSDRDKYPTKFIYGQLASTSGIQAECLDPERHGSHNLPQIADLYAALTVMPKPEVGMQDYRLFDDPKYSEKNNGDGVIDAGETIALGLTLRNRWGMSENTLVTIDTKSSISGLEDPYITIANPTVDYGSVGTYSTQDCGKVYEDELHVGWEDPFLLTVADNCPNDYRFTLNVSISCENALDEEDTAAYTSSGTVDEAVRSGKILPTIIEEDMVLTKDNLYIIPGSTVIQEGVTVRVEPGTHIQFWSDDPNDSYAESYMASLRVDGQFLVEGTKEEPVYIYPSQLMDAYNVELIYKNSGYISLKYADVTNLARGNTIHLAENCTFRINYGTGIKYRYLSGANVYNSESSSYNIAYFETARNCVFYKVGCIYDTPTLTGNMENCIFADCGLQYGDSSSGAKFTAVNCVFLGNSFNDQTQPNQYTPSEWKVNDSGSARYYNASGMGIFYREETGTTYVTYYASSAFEKALELYTDYGFAVIETEDEWEWLQANVFELNKYNTYSYYFGMVYDQELQEYTYADGTAIQDFVDPNQVRKEAFPSDVAVFCRTSCALETGGPGYVYCYSVYEIPGQILPETISFLDYEVLMDMDSTYQIAPISEPYPLSADGFLYESSDESVLTVSETGLITPVALGTADVKVYSLDRAVSNYITVNVVAYVPLESMTFTQESGEVAIGEFLETTCVLNPAETSRRSVRYTSSDPNVASVDPYSGVVTGVSSGTATITAACEELTAQMQVTVYKKSTSISVNDYLYENLSDGQVELPQVTFDGEPTLVWESTDTTVAQVVDGKLELKKAGTTNLIVTDVRTGLQDAVIVYVFENGLPAVKSVYGDYAHTRILTEDGSLFLWGNSTPYTTPTRIMTDKNIAFADGSAMYSNAWMFAVDTDGIAYLWNQGAIVETWEYLKGMDLAGAAIIGSGSYQPERYYAWTVDGTVYTWTNSTGMTAMELSFSVVDIKVSDYNSRVFFLTEDGTLYTSRYGTDDDVELVNRNVTAFERTYAEWYVMNQVLHYQGTATQMDFSGYTQVALSHAGSWRAYSLAIQEGALSLYNHYVYGTTENHEEYPIDVGEPVKQVFYDYRPFAVTDSNVVYRIDWDSNYEPSKTLAAEAIILEEFEADPFQVLHTNLTEVVAGDVQYNVLNDNSLELTFNKIPVGTSGITLEEDGYTMANTTTLEHNKLIVTSDVAFAPGHTYTLTLSADSFYAQSGATMNGDYTISFIYEEPEEDTTETEPDQEQEEAPVIHESVLDESIQRIYTAESLYAELVELQEQQQLNPNFHGNVILNRFSTDDNVNRWFRPIAPSASNYTEMPLGGNYWGSDKQKVIELQMVDYVDYTSYARLMYAPYITEAPENTFPFVTSVTLIDKNGDTVTTVGNEKVTFRVTFNRDMDTSIPLQFRFGSAYPYGDYEVEGAFVDARTWEAEYTFTTVIENGQQYLSIANGCSATDDLALQPDNARFGFYIDTTAAQALIMQGTATDTGIELRWTQDDFKTLMGYNVYRSNAENGVYTRLNAAVIPADTMTYFDATVEPGQVYYYNFTVVQSDMTESEPSGKIVIMSKDTMAPDIYHSPVTSAFTGKNLVISATVTDNLNIAYVNIYYRVTGTEEWRIIRMNNLNDKYSAIIPAEYITTAGVEYYLEAFDGVSCTYKGSAEAPYSIFVQEAIDDDALGDVNGDGVITNLDALLVLYTINGKYNMTTEEFARADLNADNNLSASEALQILRYVSGVIGSVKMT